jgi:4-hydroxythreonine-4-phosphate dehydrogenase
MKKPNIGITIGDIFGIGPEIIIKALNKRYKPCNFVIFGNSNVLKECARKLKLPFNHSIPIIEPNVQNKLTTKEGAAELAIYSLKKAVEFALNKRIDGIVTSPVNKSTLHTISKYNGHTELLKVFTKAKNVVMMFVHKTFRVVLLTQHIPIKEVSRKITKELIKETISITYDGLKKFFGCSNPKIAVASLNPHGSEIGNEEENIIKPAIKKFKSINITGPISSDIIFRKRDEFDVIIAMYHDQGLIPFKMLAFDKGVQVSLGLPFVRTSPCHGSAYDIAGKGIANPNSMIESIKLAINMVNSWKN